MMVSLVVLIQFFLILVALNLFFIAYLAWSRPHRAPEAGIIALLCLVSAVYCLGYAGEVAQSHLDQAIFWLHIEYLGIPWIPALWLLAARRHNHLPERRRLLFAIPLLTFVSQQTNQWHHLYDRSMWMVQSGPFWTVTVDRGVFAWLNLAYLNFALIYGIWIYLFGPASAQYNRLQKLALAALSLTPQAGYLLYLFGVSPWGLDIAPATLGVTVVTGYFAIIRLGCFELMPEAHSLVFNNIRDAVLIADFEHRLVDLNPAARRLLADLAPSHDSALLPAPLDELFKRSDDHVLEINIGNNTLHYEVRLFPLYHRRQHFGHAAILADITAHMHIMHELRQTADADPLTGVANRRSFLAALKQEFAATREGQSFSIMLVDFDNFKEINDQYGHPAGDKVLTAVTQRIQQVLREDDLLGRLGGDEFAILLPRIGPRSAAEVAERVRATVCAAPVACDQHSLPVSVSIGLAAYDAHATADWKELYKAADNALYEAKTIGRNRVAVWTPTA